MMAEPFIFVHLVQGYKRQVSGYTGGGVWRTGIGRNNCNQRRTPVPCALTCPFSLTRRRRSLVELGGHRPEMPSLPSPIGLGSWLEMRLTKPESGSSCGVWWAAARFCGAEMEEVGVTGHNFLTVLFLYADDPFVGYIRETQIQVLQIPDPQSPTHSYPATRISC
jgi:hypothetical protein